MPKSVPHGRVTAADIARAVGVSRATVGFVLNNTPGQTISEATRARVLEAAARMGYRPNRAATALAGGRSRIVLFVLPDWPAEFGMRRYLEEASRALDEVGYSLVTQTESAARVARPLWESLHPDVVIGPTQFSAADVASMRDAGITRIVPHPDQSVSLAQAPGVSEGVRLQVDHLQGLGHRRIVYAVPSDPRMDDIVGVRADVAKERAAVHGLELVEVRTVGPAAELAARAVRDWHGAGITAVAAFNDDTAAAVVGAAVRAGLRVPADLAVIGHDDSPFSALFVPSLSTVRIDAVLAARYVTQVALHEVEGREMPSAPHESITRLVFRESTLGGAPADGRSGAVDASGAP